MTRKKDEKHREAVYRLYVPRRGDEGDITLARFKAPGMRSRKKDGSLAMFPKEVREEMDRLREERQETIYGFTVLLDGESLDFRLTWETNQLQAVHEVPVRLYMFAERRAEVEDAVENIHEHLDDTFNDDGSFWLLQRDLTK